MIANVALSGVGGLALGALQLVDVAGSIYRNRRVIVRIPERDGGQFVLRGADVVNTRLIPGDSTDEWALQLRRGVDGTRGAVVLTGGEARRMAARVMPHVNQEGSTRKETESAVKHLEEAGDPQRFLAWAARRVSWRNTRDIGIGIEMAVNEENEREALEHELTLLEDAWKEAEEIAAISDRLLLPRDIEDKLGALRNGRQS